MPASRYVRVGVGVQPRERGRESAAYHSAETSRAALLPSARRASRSLDHESDKLSLEKYFGGMARHDSRAAMSDGARAAGSGGSDGGNGSSSSAPQSWMDLKSPVFDVEVHPTRRLVMAGTVSGRISFLRVSGQGSLSLSASVEAHSGACRSLVVNKDGGRVYSVGSDSCIAVTDVETARAIGARKAAHDHAINCAALSRENSLLVTGDDEGYVRMWDSRQNASAARWRFEEHGDFVSDMYCCSAPREHTVLVTSGDGTLSTYDMRKGCIDTMSDKRDGELMCVQPVPGGKKIVCGASDGALEIFSWDMMGQPDDRFLGHPDSVDAICALDKTTFVTGSADGVLRAVELFPNKLLGVIGQHDGPVDCVRLSPHTPGRVFSCGHDNMVRVWDLGDDDDDQDDASQPQDGKAEPESKSGSVSGAVAGGKREAAESRPAKRAAKRARIAVRGKGTGGGDFFDGM